MATPTFTDRGNRFSFVNDDGTYYVWKNVTNDGSGNLVGPGYLGHVYSSVSGKRVTEGFVAPATTVNDPRMQGFGIAGWHHYRNIPGEPNIWNKGWDFRGNMLPGSDPFGVSTCDIPFAPYADASGNIRASFGVNFVDRYSSAAGKRVMSVRYDYIFEPSDVKMWVTFTVMPDGDDGGPPMFVKEPKLAFGTGPNTADGYKPTALSIFDSASTELRLVDLVNDPNLQNPTTGTVQVGFDTRVRARFYDSSEYWNVVGRGNTLTTYGTDQKVSGYGTRTNWEGGGQGLDNWAHLANPRAELDSTVCAAYCKQGGGGESGLTRQWEVAKRHTEPNVEIMFHGWEGGSGLPDCLCCAKSAIVGEKYTNYFSISKDVGWIL